MLEEIILAIIQAATEFLPVSSSGHLALVSGLISQPNLFFFTALHIASLIAVLIFMRKEIYSLITFERRYRKMWIYLIIATIPAGLFGYFFHSFIESTFSSLLYIGLSFIFTGLILLSTRNSKVYSKLNFGNSLGIGFFQALSLFPGVSRSGMTISSGLLFGIEREKTVKFSFLLFIPLSIGAFILESGNFYFSWSLLISFFICLIFSLIFLVFLVEVVRKRKFWLFSIYCFIIGLLTLAIYFF